MKSSLWLAGLIISGGLLAAAPIGLGQTVTEASTDTSTSSVAQPVPRASINWRFGATWTVADQASTATLPNNFDHVYTTGETVALPVDSLHVPGFKIDEHASTLDFGDGHVFTYTQVLGQGYTDIDQAYQALNGEVVPEGGDYADSTAIFTTVLVPDLASVTVNYIVAGTNAPLAAVTLTSTFGYTVDLPARSFEGYTLAADQPTTYHITTPGESAVTVAYTPVTTPTPDPDQTPNRIPTSTPKPTSTPSTPTQTDTTIVNTSTKQKRLPETGDWRQSSLTITGLVLILLASTLIRKSWRPSNK